MWTRYIFAALAVAFSFLALVGALNRGAGPRTRTWILIAGIFAAVSGYLFYQG